MCQNLVTVLEGLELLLLSGWCRGTKAVEEEMLLFFCFLLRVHKLIAVDIVDF